MADIISALDSSEKKPSWGGVRPNSGRPKGSMNKETKERIAVKNAFQERVAYNADTLFNAQFNLAKGEQYLMWKHKVGKGTKERTVVEVVDDPETIKAYLDDTLDVDPDEFYYISTKPANGMAIDSLLDRSFGKADSKLDMTTNGKDLPTSQPVSQDLLQAFIATVKDDTKQK